MATLSLPKLFAATALLVRETKDHVQAQHAAGLLYDWALQCGCPFDSDVNQMLSRIADTRRADNLLRHSVKLKKHHLFAVLNPMLLNRGQINHIAGPHPGSTDEWISAVRNKLRKDANPAFKRERHKLALCLPMDPATGLYYHEIPERVHAHADTCMYLYHAQAWAFRLYATYWQKNNGEHTPCRYCQMTAPQMLEYAMLPFPFRALNHMYDHFQHGLTLIAPGLGTAKLLRPRQFERECLDAAAKLGYREADYTRLTGRRLFKPMRRAPTSRPIPLGVAPPLRVIHAPDNDPDFAQVDALLAEAQASPTKIN